jgi:hypothetical protein
MRDFSFVNEHFLLISLLVLLGGVCLLFVDAAYQHSTKSYHLTHLTTEEKIQRVNKALEAVEMGDLLLEVDDVLKRQDEGDVNMLLGLRRLFPVLHRFCWGFGFAAATWKKYHLPHYGYVLALVRPFRGEDTDAVCIMPANVRPGSLVVDDRHVWISNRILVVFGFKGCSGWCDDVAE